MPGIFMLLLFAVLFSCNPIDEVSIDGEIYRITHTGTKDSLILHSYYENGKLKLIRSVKNGVDYGPFLLYDDTGILRSKSLIVNGKLEGKAMNYDSLGNLSQELEFKNGMKQGVQKSFDVLGDLEEIKYYSKDSLFYSKSFVSDIEEITPILTIVSKDRIFVGDTLTLQYRLPNFDEICNNKKLFLFVSIDEVLPNSELGLPADSLLIKCSRPDQIGLKIEHVGQQIIYGFVADRGKNIVDYKPYRKRIMVYKKSD